MTLYETISTEFDNLGLVRVPNALERFCASVGCHIFNISNLQNKRFYFGGNLENFRTSIIFMAPSGYSKSQHFSYFLNPRTGILAKSGILTTIRGTFSTESWMGTITNGKESKGILSTFKQGIVGADEFMRLANLMSGQGISHDEVYIMKALDTDTVTKDLAYGAMEEQDIGMTLWAGMRLCNLTLTSGLARRFSFQIFFPTINDSLLFRQAARSGKMQSRVRPEIQELVKTECESAIEHASAFDTIDYKGVEDWIDKNDFSIPHFEEVLYKRLALGWSIVTDTFPKIEMTEPLQNLLADEVRTRDIIRTDPLHEAMRGVLHEAGQVKALHFMKFLEKNYQLHKVEVEALVNDLKRREIIVTNGEWLRLSEDMLGQDKQ